MGMLNFTVIQGGGPALPGEGKPRQPVASAQIEVTLASTSDAGTLK
jgi:hypothetical protein